jgi:hypothetical protein
LRVFGSTLASRTLRKNRPVLSSFDAHSLLLERGLRCSVLRRYVEEWKGAAKIKLNEGGASQAFFFYR